MAHQMEMLSVLLEYEWMFLLQAGLTDHLFVTITMCPSFNSLGDYCILVNIVCRLTKRTGIVFNLNNYCDVALHMNTNNGH